MKRLMVGLLVGLLFGSVVGAEELPTMKEGGDSQFDSKVGNLDIGYLKVGTQEIFNLAWHPDFKFGPLGLGADINIKLTEGSPSGYENYILRYVEYSDGQKGLRYGVIQKLTWGQGLLLDGYSTWLTGSVILNSDQLAWLGYYNLDLYTIRAMTTPKGLYGIRAEKPINPMLTLGLTYISDSNGVAVPNTTITQTETGIAVDALMPTPLGIDGYAEYAVLLNRGGGLDIGLKWAQDFMVAAADFTAGYRLLDRKFVPGYFNSDYDFNPINLTSAEASAVDRNGYLIKFGLKALGMAAANIRYEAYNNTQAAVYGDLFGKFPNNIEVTGYYQQPTFKDFRSLEFDQGAILGGTLAYPVNAYTKAIVHLKRFYDTTTRQVETTRRVELKFSLAGLVPGL